MISIICMLLNMQNSWWHYLFTSGDVNNFHRLSKSFKKSVGNSLNRRFIIEKWPRMAQSGPEAAASTLLYCPNHTRLSSKQAHWKFSRFLLQNPFDCKHSSCFSDLIATFSVLNTLRDKLSKMRSKVFLQSHPDLHSWGPIILEERQLSDTL